MDTSPTLQVRRFDSYLAWLIGGLAAYLLVGFSILPLALVGKVSPHLGHLLDESPGMFVTYAILGLFAGRMIAIWSRFDVKWTVFAIPLALLLNEARLMLHEPQSNLAYVYDTFLGRNCQASECLYELMDTSPLVLAFALWVGSHAGTRTVDEAAD